MVVSLVLVLVTNSQLKFGGSSTSSSGSSSSNDKQAVDNKDVDTRFISTGSELIDGGLLGVGAGLLGGAVLGGVLGNNNNNNPCGRRRRRQADGKDGTDTRFFLPNLGGGGGCNCGRRKRRQAPHGACRRADETGRAWCYTYGGCPDSRPSKRFPNN